MTDSYSSDAEYGEKGRRFRAVASAALEAPIFAGPTSALKRPAIVLLAPPEYRYSTPPAENAYLPVQKVVDRRPKSPPQLDRTLRRKELIDKDTGHLDGIAFTYALGNFGPDPNDPGAFSLPIPFVTAICPTLASYAAARCGLR